MLKEFTNCVGYFQIAIGAVRLKGIALGAAAVVPIVKLALRLAQGSSMDLRQI